MYFKTISRIKLIFITIFLVYVPYFITNHLIINHTVLPYILYEDKIPFLPWTIIIYLSLFVQCLLVISVIKREHLKRVFIILSSMILICVTLFIVFPTGYPRIAYLSTNKLLTLFRFIDNPVNCFPSLHVCSTLLFAYFFEKYSQVTDKTYKLLFWFWSILIIISTLTTKQHYLIDIFASMSITAIIMFIDNKIKSR